MTNSARVVLGVFAVDEDALSRAAHCRQSGQVERVRVHKRHVRAEGSSVPVWVVVGSFVEENKS